MCYDRANLLDGARARAAVKTRIAPIRHDAVHDSTARGNGTVSGLSEHRARGAATLRFLDDGSSAGLNARDGLGLRAEVWGLAQAVRASLTHTAIDCERGQVVTGQLQESR